MRNVRWSSRVDLTTWQTRSEGRFRQSRKPLYARAYCGFESHSLRHLTCNISVFQDVSRAISMRSHIEAHIKALPDAHGPKQLAAWLSCSLSPPASHHDWASRAISWSVPSPSTRPSARPTIPGQGVRSPNSRTVRSSLKFSLTIALTAEPGASRGEPVDGICRGSGSVSPPVARRARGRHRSAT